VRGLQQASYFPKLKRELGLGRFSLGSWSESVRVFDPELLVGIIEALSEQVQEGERDERLSALSLAPTLVDGTLLHALPKMTWALWLDKDKHAAKLHLHYELFKGAPIKATLTNGQESEVRELSGRIEPGRLYVLDRGYFAYELLRDITAAKSSFLVRVRANVVYETIQERPISRAAARENVVSDRIVRLGSKPTAGVLDRPVRLVEIHTKDDPNNTRRANLVDPKTKQYRTRAKDHTILLVTDQMDLDAELVSLLYRCRWQIEIYFRWLKTVLKADRLLSLSEDGMTIVMYCALIASLLVTLWTGGKPTKRTWELICFYFLGWVDEPFLVERLAKLEKAGQ
jgi:hypothetical protein